MLLIALFAFSVNIVASNDVVPSTKKVVKDEYIDYTNAFKRIDSTKLPDVIAKIEEARADSKVTNIFNSHFDISDISVPIMIIFIIFFIQYYRFKKKKELYLLFTKIIESGKEIPIELLQQPKKKRSDLRTGLIFLAIGIAISIGAFVIDKDILLIGIIPLFLGIAFIVFHFLNKKKNDN